MISKTQIAAAALVFLGSLPAAAQEPLITDRPDFTESTPTLDRGRLQLESGVTWTRFDDASEERSLGELLLRAGAGERLELRLAVNYLDGDPGVGGIDDPVAGVKLRLFEPSAAGALPAASLILETTVPVGSHAVAEREWQGGVKALFAWALPRGLALGSNVNLTRASEDGERFDELAASLTVGGGLGGPWSAYAEVVGAVRTDGHGDETFANAGLTVLLSPDLQLDGRVGAGLGGSAPEIFAGLGLAARF